RAHLPGAPATPRREPPAAVPQPIQPVGRSQDDTHEQTDGASDRNVQNGDDVRDQGTDDKHQRWILYTKTPGRSARAFRIRCVSRCYEALAAVRRVATAITTGALTGLATFATFARAVARARLRAFTMKHFSSALS